MMLHKSGLILADPKNADNNLKYVADINIENLGIALEESTASFNTAIGQQTYQVDSFKIPEYRLDHCRFYGQKRVVRGFQIDPVYGIWFDGTGFIGNFGTGVFHFGQIHQADQWHG